MNAIHYKHCQFGLTTTFVTVPVQLMAVMPGFSTGIFPFIPAIVRDLDDDETNIIMVDSNLQRENILPSERAKTYQMKMEAMAPVSDIALRSKLAQGPFFFVFRAKPGGQMT